MSGFATCMKRSLCIPASVFLVIMFIAEAGAQEPEALLDLSLPADTNTLDMELDDTEPADFKSRTVGRKKRWQLDRGHIDSEAVTPELRESESD
ncbi:MAG: hypothetical protein KAI41_03490, partial [Hyphomicrobiaceae bacterium]|nr:hypothetical protein [Hyphomicrobiaceae bacterium]